MVDDAQLDFAHHPVTTRLNSAKSVEPELVNPAYRPGRLAWRRHHAPALD
jgi:hypothetical protein